MKKSLTKQPILYSTYLLIVFSIIVGLFSCKQENKNVEKKPAEKFVPEIVQIDTSITVENAVFPEFIDSTSVAKFLQENAQFQPFEVYINNFYRKRNYQYGWYDEKGLAPQANAFINKFAQYIVAVPDSLKKFGPEMIGKIDGLMDEIYWTDNNEEVKPNPETDILLTALYFDYTDSQNNTPESELRNLDWLIPKKKLNLENALEELIKDTSIVADIHPMYFLLQRKLIDLKEMEADYDANPLKFTLKKAIALGDSSEHIPAIRQKLAMLHDLPANANIQSTKYDDELLQAVVNFRKRHGMKPDTTIAQEFVNEINVPLKDRIRTVLINMERLKWMPADMYNEYLLVNIPEFKLHAFRQDSLLWSMRVVVGKATSETVIFNDKIEYVVFSPYWYIPNSIIYNEMLPQLLKNPSNYLKSKDMELYDSKKNTVAASSVDWNNVRATKKIPYGIRQKSGAQNALGKVKFLFPNEHNIYLHDTPSKKYFKETERAFSHGCIRVEEPKKLAEYLLQNQSEWTPETIEKAMDSGVEKYVNVKPSVPVVIGYWTAWVDGRNNLNFRNDIYENDKLMAAKILAD